MFDKARDARHVKRLLQIKLRDNQYLPNIKIKAPQKKLNKSKSQLLNLSHEIATNRKHLNSVNKALHKSKPVDYYDNGKYIYEKNIERYQKLFMDNLKNKNEKEENAESNENENDEDTNKEISKESETSKKKKINKKKTKKNAKKIDKVPKKNTHINDKNDKTEKREKTPDKTKKSK